MPDSRILLNINYMKSQINGFQNTYLGYMRRINGHKVQLKIDIEGG